MEELIREIEDQKDLMITVSTGGPRIDSVNETYKTRRSKIRSELAALKIEDPNPHRDLWEWYGRWSSGELPTYRSRRDYIRGLYAPLLEKLEEGASPTVSVRDPTGWNRVDRGIDKIRRQLATSKNAEDFQTVGLLCRETLISLAQAVFDSDVHQTEDGVVPSNTDANRMLEAFIKKEFSGGSNEEVRKHAKASLALANAIQHQRTATFKNAALCSEATSSVVNIIAIVSERSDPEAQDSESLTGQGYEGIMQVILNSDPIKDWNRTEKSVSVTFVYKANVNLSFHVDYETGSHNDDFKEEWANRYPDPKARSYYYDLYYGSSLLEQFILVSVDGARARLPIPTIGTTVVPLLYYKVAQIFGSSNLSLLEEYMQRSGLSVSER